MQNVYTIEQIRNLLTPVFHKNNVRKAVLFGSYSKGKATPFEGKTLTGKVKYLFIDGRLVFES